MSSNIQPTTSNTNPPIQHNQPLFRRALNFFQHIGLYIKLKLQLYLALLTLYTPIGQIKEYISGPRSLQQWDPTRSLSKGFLSDTIPIPDPLNPDIDKRLDTSRVSLWACKEILKLARLAQRTSINAAQGDASNSAHEMIDSHINNLRKAIKQQDIQLACDTVFPIIIALHPIISSELNTEGRNAYRNKMLHLSSLLVMSNLIKHKEDAIHELSMPEQAAITITSPPQTQQELLELAIAQSVPAIKYQNTNQREQDAKKTKLAVARNKLALSLHMKCIAFEQGERHAAAKAQEFADVQRALDGIDVSMPKYEPGERELLWLKTINDIINHHHFDTESALYQLILKSFSNACPSVRLRSYMLNDDNIEQTEILAYIKRHDSALDDIARFLNGSRHNIITKTFSLIVEEMKKQQMHSDDIAKVNRWINNLRYVKVSPAFVRQAFTSRPTHLG